ncbi:siderophore-interacting protein [Paramicrobacterium agarici]|uniref:ATP-binding cassette subfamily B protein IrtA n=1 Tax=Paramicrobacterium agarici TaxID=630514 RepID=A0A2A9DVZ3_9MICO|nr:siderophore-interacting protein [Microbacterium agarici]PFG30511.1 ATP-binding cassette subfamily B protein IrtA [Microbacterium agarici]
MTIVEIVDVTPRYRRIIFSAPDLVEALEIFPTAWLRLWIPNPDRGERHLSQRGYTFVDVNADNGTFGLEFVLHETKGPAGDWARAANVGDVSEVALTPARISLPEGTREIVLAGDITALPAINSWVSDLDASVQARVFIEDDHHDVDQLPAVTRSGDTWAWIRREGKRGEALAEHLRAAVAPSARQYAWAAGEKTLVKHVRAVMKDHLGLIRGQHFSQFYWIEGHSPA